MNAIALVSDLMFSTKITHAARSVGVEVRAVSSGQALAEALDEGDVPLVMVDMTVASDQAAAGIESCVSREPRPTIIAFYPHVQSDLREAAETAGADLIMPRSKFDAQLPQLLQQYGLLRR